MSKVFNIEFQAPYYSKYLRENGGHLDRHKACHALFHYAVTALNTFINHERTTLVYEGEPDLTYNYPQLFRSITEMYSVTGEEATKYWNEVDNQMRALGMGTVPDEDRFRFYNWQGQTSCN